MLKYVYINKDKTVGAVVPEFDPIFPEIPIDKRYSATFLEKCITVDESVEVRGGMGYNEIAGIFFDKEI